MSEATVTSKGQITIPADVRKALSLETGTKVVFTRLKAAPWCCEASRARRSMLQAC